MLDLRVGDFITQPHVRHQFLVNPAAREVSDEAFLLVLDQQHRIQISLVQGSLVPREIPKWRICGHLVTPFTDSIRDCHFYQERGGRSCPKIQGPGWKWFRHWGYPCCWFFRSHPSE